MLFARSELTEEGPRTGRSECWLMDRVVMVGDLIGDLSADLTAIDRMPEPPLLEFTAGAGLVLILGIALAGGPFRRFPELGTSCFPFEISPQTCGRSPSASSTSLCTGSGLDEVSIILL
mmetsp:Transcript_70532/g.153212  ORF Transcript_70532/g.153212 Transcript_70532/m.153212 type:complete len:119 (-) Transcript_70532:173-529(-)